MTKTAGSNAANRHGAGQEHPGQRRGLRDEQVRHAARPATRVIVLTTFDDDEHLYPALRAGAHGFLAKDAMPEEALDAIRRVPDGTRRSVRRCSGGSCTPRSPRVSAPKRPLPAGGS
ncbi:response regulator [Amycolatopsis sp. 3B14]|uniref:response regulator n=1 Tax=Amycolatopsis sp. 3B14 TaxID=3243600 RepID=UPI003D98A518